MTEAFKDAMRIHKLNRMRQRRADIDMRRRAEAAAAMVSTAIKETIAAMHCQCNACRLRRSVTGGVFAAGEDTDAGPVISAPGDTKH